MRGIPHAGLGKSPPLPPRPHHPGRRSAGLWKAAARGVTLPQPLESAARFPQLSGHDDDQREKGGGKTPPTS